MKLIFTHLCSQYANTKFTDTIQFFRSAEKEQKITKSL